MPVNTVCCNKHGHCTSKLAAKQCAELSYTASYNIAEGFGGDLDKHNRRNSESGWRRHW